MTECPGHAAAEERRRRSAESSAWVGNLPRCRTDRPHDLPPLQAIAPGTHDAMGRSQETLMASLDTIVVPIDFSETSRDALRFAKELARPFQARLHLLHVIPDPLKE